MIRGFIPALCLAFSILPHSLCAVFTPLKGANGQIVEFQVQAVEADGLRAIRKGGYKTLLLAWEQLDLAWLKKHQVALWNQKAQIEKMQDVAYQDYRFGMTRREVIITINSRNGVRLPNETFGEDDPATLWISFDPQNYNQLYRFVFNDKGLLNEVQIHHSFNEDDNISGAMQSEWSRLVKLVSGYGSNLRKAEDFPDELKWKRHLRDDNREAKVTRVTHQWEDKQRQFVLALERKKMNVGRREVREGELTLFGKQIFVQPSPPGG